MKKKYLLITLVAFVMAFTFSSCLVERPHYYHPHHGYYRY